MTAQQHWCEYCGAPMDTPPPEAVTIGACELLAGPGHPALIYGSRSVALAPQEATILSLLSKRISVSSEVLQYIVSPDSECAANVVQTVLCNLRRKLRTNDIPLAIENLSGACIGGLYQLVIKPSVSAVG